jgi:hypothetical protein
LGMLDHLSNNRPLSSLGAWSAPNDLLGKASKRFSIETIPRLAINLG